MKCKFGEDFVRFPLKESTTWEEFMVLVEKEWGGEKGVQFRDEEGDWVKMRKNDELKYVLEETKNRLVTLRVFSEKSRSQVNFLFFF